MALDRIQEIKFDLSKNYDNRGFDADSYYKDTIGVTVMPDKELLEITLSVNRYNAPYVLTKPLHHSQRLLEKSDDGSIIISLRVHNNFELHRLILGFGFGIKVLKPRKLKQQIKKTLIMALSKYEEK